MNAIAILYADDHIAIVDKPSGLLVHRGGFASEEVVAMTLARDALGRYVYPVHRLDRGTSGVLAFALDAATARTLHEGFEAGLVNKRYLALVRGVPPASFEIDSPVRRGEDGPRVPAFTAFRTLASIDRYALVEARPKTGRLHQIRRHLKHASHPILGDVNYGKGEHNRLFRERHGLARLALHAASLTFTHPVSGATVSTSAPLPRDLGEPLVSAGFSRELLLEAHLLRE